MINTLQNYYGLAIRQNKGNAYGMRKSIAALINHCSAHSNDNIRHQFCPTGPDSWCKYQSDKVTNKKTSKNHISLPPAVAELIKPIFS